jgi:hypothetical protein
VSARKCIALIARIVDHAELSPLNRKSEHIRTVIQLSFCSCLKWPIFPDPVDSSVEHFEPQSFCLSINSEQTICL